MDKSEEKAKVFKTLSVKARVVIIELLKVRPRCVNAISHELQLTPAAASQHLRILRDAGVVDAKKDGYFVHYSLNKTVFDKWFEIAKEFFE